MIKEKEAYCKRIAATVEESRKKLETEKQDYLSGEGSALAGRHVMDTPELTRHVTVTSRQWLDTARYRAQGLSAYAKLARLFAVCGVLCVP